MALAHADSFLSALIIVLFDVGRPSAIFGRVWSVIVNAVDTIAFGRARTHIGIKVLKRVQPSVTNGDAASAPIGVIFPIDIKASFLDALPRVVFSSVSSSVLSGGFIGGFDGVFIAPASAASGITALKIRDINDDSFSAIASATPMDRVSTEVGRTLRFFNDKKSAKALAGAIFKTMSVLTGCGIIGHDISSFLAVSTPRVFPHRSAICIGLTGVIIPQMRRKY